MAHHKGGKGEVALDLKNEPRDLLLGLGIEVR